MFSRYATVCVFLFLAGYQAQLASSEESVSLQKCREYGKLFHGSADIHFPDSELSKHCNERHFSNDKKAQLGEFPYMAAVKYNTTNGGQRFSCTGALISKNYVILPAYCADITKKNQRPVSVRLGELSTFDNNVGPNGLEVNVIDVVVHPGYKKTENVLALLKLEKDVVFTKNIHPICLNGKTITDTAALASGWNFPYRFDETDERKNQILKSKFNLFTKEQCAEIYKPYRSEIHDDQICAGFKDTLPEIEPSGTIQVENKDVPCMDSLLGLVSFGPVRPGAKSIPDVYTTIHPHISWIESVIWG